MGDTGSMSLGFILAVVSLQTSMKSGTAVSLLVPIISLGLPIIDTLLAMVRRSLMGRPLFSADKEHIHHRLMSRMVMSHRRAVLVLYGLCCLFTLIALTLAFASSAQSALLLFCVGVVVVVLMRKLGYLDMTSANAMGDVRKKNQQLRVLVRESNERLGTARTFEAVWVALKPFADGLGAARCALRLKPESGSTEALLFEQDRGTTGSPLELNLPIRDGEEVLGWLGITWRDGRKEVDRDEELALELVTDSIAKAIVRGVMHRGSSNVIPLHGSR
jgi:UDP-GlcNAc:undecaprenyl-phosphate GlcNAc-1-phosphate transferase